MQSLRLPRAISGLAVGIALGVAGALLQAAVRNPLAEPGTLGVNAGAALGVTLAAVLGLSAGALTSVPFALAGGGLAALIVLGLGRGSNDPVRMILAGTAVAFAFMGAASALQIIYAQGYVSGGLQIWGNGTIEQPGWAPVRAIAPVIPLIAFAALALMRDLDALMLGDEHAEALGVNARRARHHRRDDRRRAVVRRRRAGRPDRLRRARRPAPRAPPRRAARPRAAAGERRRQARRSCSPRTSSRWRSTATRSRPASSAPSPARRCSF